MITSCGITERQMQRATQDRRTHLLNELYKMDVEKTNDGRQIEECSLFTLEQVHANEKCRSTILKGEKDDL